MGQLRPLREVTRIPPEGTPPPRSWERGAKIRGRGPTVKISKGVRSVLGTHLPERGPSALRCYGNTGYLGMAQRGTSKRARLGTDAS